MKIISITKSENGAYSAIQSGWGGDVPDGYAIVPDNFDLADFYAYKGFGTFTFADGTAVSFAPDQAAFDAWEAAHPDTTAPDLDDLKSAKIADSKTRLAAYLLAHPMTWTDGRQYSVTAEKQSLLTSQLALYSAAAAAGQTCRLRWNTTGEECIDWTCKDLTALALAIGVYVQPFVSAQQAKEVEISHCTTAAEVEAITIEYASVSA